MDTLREVIARFRTAPAVGVDTEFMRERTYYAKLCLVQIGTDDLTAIIDPIALPDLTPLCELLCDTNVVKVLHAGGQDLEIFYRLCGCATAPVFDTQVAATLAGFPQQVGYAALVRELLDVELDKGDTYSDWSKRPLTETQVCYARNDVAYLPEVYRLLKERLESEGRMGWLAADFARMEEASTYETDFAELWRKVKRISSLNRRQLAVAREVTAWREHEAMRRDVPKRWVLGDESIVEVARRAPRSAEELSAIRGVGDKVGRAAVSALLDAVARGLAVPDDELPGVKKRRRPIGDVDSAVDVMVAVLRVRARQHGVAMPLLASRDDLERLAAGDRDGHPLLEGWRKSMVGDELVELLEGKLDLRLDDGGLVITKHPQA